MNRFIRSVSFLAFVFLIGTALAEQANEGDFPGTINCAITGEIPEKPRSLSFCNKFNDLACCPPAMDGEDNEMFDTMMNLGLSCRLRGDIRDNPIAKFYCMNCDPQQPKYIRNEPYVPTCDDLEDGCGTAYSLYQLYPGTLFTSGSPATITYASASAADIDSLKEPLEEYDAAYSGNSFMPSSPRAQQILICKEWAQAEFGPLTGDSNTAGFLGLFNRCGIMKSSPCLDGAGTVIPDRDRYTCGDDLIIPSVTYTSVEQFLNADSLGPPGLDESFGFKLVSAAQCTTAQLDAYEALLGDPLDGGDLQALGYDLYNPDCLRTIDQIKKYGVSPWSSSFDSAQYNAASANAGDYLSPNTDEKCFDSAAQFAPLAGVAAVLMVLATVLLL